MTNTEWVSVEERLPEKYTDVLVYCFSGSIEVALIDGDGVWGDGVATLGELYGDGVTHWMPIPEPPEDRKEKT